MELELLISEKEEERIFQELFFLPSMTHRFVDFVMESSTISRISTHITFNLAPRQQSSSLLRSYGLNKKKIYLPAVSSPIPSLIQPQNHSPSSRAPYHRVSASWFQGLSLGTGNKTKEHYADIVKAGDPVLHEPTADVEVDQIGSESIQNIIDQMIRAMRKAPGVGLAAPQIGVPLKIVVVEDTKEYISYASKSEVEAQDRRPFDLLVIVNPKLKMKSNKTAFFFEGCLSLDGYRALVERNLEVEVTGYDRDGKPIKVNATGWQARILQHECDHLEGTVYVDRMVPRTFRTVENLALPLATGCPKLGPRYQ